MPNEQRAPIFNASSVEERTRVVSDNAPLGRRVLEEWYSAMSQLSGGCSWSSENCMLANLWSVSDEQAAAWGIAARRALSVRRGEDEVSRSPEVGKFYQVVNSGVVVQILGLGKDGSWLARHVRSPYDRVGHRQWYASWTAVFKEVLPTSDEGRRCDCEACTRGEVANSTESIGERDGN
jgi:hypothetical protein